ncbi:MAG: L-threonylcarbamoyladenylate synthase [Phycisphaerae bacterium]
MVRLVAVFTCLEPAVSALRQAAALIRAGELVAFPTETVYGLGGDAGNNLAIQRIYQVKGRPAHNPLIVHVPDMAAAQQYVTAFSPVALALANQFWPGPLTMVLPRNDRICPAVSAGKNTVAIRCPRHPVALALLQESGRPIAAPSANRSGYTSPTTAAHVSAELSGLIPLILDGGPCLVGLESTVVDVTGTVPVILRPGAVTPRMLAESLAAAGFSSAVNVLAGHDATTVPADVKSPGLLPSHYAPRTPAYRFSASKIDRLRRYLRQIGEQRIGLLCWQQFAELPTDAETRVLPAAAPACARELYGALRDLDTRRCDVLLIQYPEAVDGLWLAIADRVRRATKELPL